MVCMFAGRVIPTETIHRTVSLKQFTKSEHSLYFSPQPCESRWIRRNTIQPCTCLCVLKKAEQPTASQGQEWMKLHTACCTITITTTPLSPFVLFLGSVLVSLGSTYWHVSICVSVKVTLQVLRASLDRVFY